MFYGVNDFFSGVAIVSQKILSAKRFLWYNLSMEFKDLIKEALSVSAGRELSEGAYFGGVGAALETMSGKIYHGTCIDCFCGIGTCAEHAAVLNMLMNGESEIKKIVAVKENGEILPPCGRCRELLYMVNAKNAETEFMVAKNEVKKLKDLLPNPYLGYYQ